MQVAKTILEQLGGNKFLAMTGAKNLVSVENGLTMHLPTNKAKAKYLKIEVTANDTYNMTFQTFSKKDFTFPVVAQFENVYFDQLQSVFTSTTGMDTSL